MSTISASTTSTTAYKVTADTTGTLVLQTGSTPTTAVTIDTSQNMGLGVTPSNAYSDSRSFEIGANGIVWSEKTSSVYNSLGVGVNFYYNAAGDVKYKSTGVAASKYNQYQGAHQWLTASSGTAGAAITFTQAMTLDANGKLLVGSTSSIGAALVQSRSSNTTTVSNTYAWNQEDKGIVLRNDSDTTNSAIGLTLFGGGNGNAAAGVYLIQETANSLGALAFYTGGSGRSNTVPERARITSSGGLWVGTSTRLSTSNHIFVQNTVNDWTANFQCNTGTSSQNLGVLIYYAGSSPNNTSAQFLLCQDPGGTRAEVRSNGGLANYSANNANLSDVRTKTDIQDAGSYLSKICAIPVRTFKYKDQTDDLLNLGVIAQEVETVAPELVDVSGFGETPEDGVPLKAIYQTDLQYALMKCIQEQQAIIEQLRADVETLKGAA